jgi:hypothetical protein
MPRQADLVLPDPFGEGSVSWGHWGADNARRGGLVLLGPTEAAEGFAEAGYEVWQIAIPDAGLDPSRACQVLAAMLDGIEGPRFIIGHDAAGPCAWRLAIIGAGLTAGAAYGAFEPLGEAPALPFILQLDAAWTDDSVEGLRDRFAELKIHRLSSGADLARLRTLAVFSRASGRGEGA